MKKLYAVEGVAVKSLHEAMRLIEPNGDTKIVDFNDCCDSLDRFGVGVYKGRAIVDCGMIGKIALNHFEAEAVQNEC